MNDQKRTEIVQKEHYDSIAHKYNEHYGDTYSLAYRKKFINEPMLQSINISGRKVLDAMCGSGETTGYLVQANAAVTGLDISEEEIHKFRERWPQCTAQCGSIFSSGFEDNTYDCVVVVGGLHHLHPNISEAIDEIYRILKVDGYFCFMEPHKGSFPDRVRKYWYKRDKLFAENEASVDIRKIKLEYSSKFKLTKEYYGGNLAYLFVLNSLVFRIPVILKPFYAPMFFLLESVIGKFQRKWSSCFAICQFKKI